MNREMNKVELITKMYEMVSEKLVAYKTDLMYDIDTLYTTNNNVYYWFLRDTGTHFTSNVAMVETFKEYNDEMYIIERNMDGLYTIKKVWEK